MYLRMDKVQIYHDVMVSDTCYPQDVSVAQWAKFEMMYPIFRGALAASVYLSGPYEKGSGGHVGDEPIFAVTVLAPTYYEYPFGLSPYSPVMDL